VIRAYHVDRLGNQLTAGQIVNLSHTQDLRSEAHPHAQYIVRHLPDGLSMQGIRYLGELHPPITNGATTRTFSPSTLIEIVAELTRRSNFPDCPSRLQSFFAFETVTDARVFASAYPAASEGETKPDAVIWEVESNGIGFRGDMRWLSVGNSWLDLLVNTENYWGGLASDAPQWEMLLRPPVTITRRVQTLSSS